MTSDGDEGEVKYIDVENEEVVFTFGSDTEWSYSQEQILEWSAAALGWRPDPAFWPAFQCSVSRSSMQQEDSLSQCSSSDQTSIPVAHPSLVSLLWIRVAWSRIFVPTCA